MKYDIGTMLNAAHHPELIGIQMAKQTQGTVMTIDDLAKYLKLSKSTLYKLCAEGKVPGTKVGRHWRFHLAVIDHWLGQERKRST